MRTQEQIIARINERKGGDMLGFEWQEYLEYLTVENALPFLRAGTTVEQLKDSGVTLPCEMSPRDKLVSYMGFAWEKANGQRGISANRSVLHIIAWLWLDESPIADEIQEEYESDYCCYGKPILEKVCEHYGVDWKALDDGERTN